MQQCWCATGRGKKRHDWLWSALRYRVHLGIFVLLKFVEVCLRAVDSSNNAWAWPYELNHTLSPPPPPHPSECPVTKVRLQDAARRWRGVASCGAACGSLGYFRGQQESHLCSSGNRHQVKIYPPPSPHDPFLLRSPRGNLRKPLRVTDIRGPLHQGWSRHGVIQQGS